MRVAASQLAVELLVGATAALWNAYVYHNDAMNQVGHENALYVQAWTFVASVGIAVMRLWWVGENSECTPLGSAAASVVLAYYGLGDGMGAVWGLLEGQGGLEVWDSHEDRQGFPTAPFNHFYAVFSSTRLIGATFADESGMSLAATLTFVWALLARWVNVRSNEGIVDEVPGLVIMVPYLLSLLYRRDVARRREAKGGVGLKTPLY